MDNVIINLLMGLGILWFMALCAYSVYLRVIAPKPDDSADRLGKLLYYYGQLIIYGTLVVGVLTLSIIFAFWVINAVGMGV